MRSGRRIRFPMNVSMKGAYKRSLHVKKRVISGDHEIQATMPSVPSFMSSYKYIHNFSQKIFFTGVRMQRDHSHVQICTTKGYKI